jgi:putative FmdB family regulatory protein
MPFYEYECESCKFYTEVMQKISDAPLVRCPSCGKRTLKKLVSVPVFRLKGSGWYETDFKSDKEAKRNLLAAEKEEAKPEVKGAPADAKPGTTEAKETKETKDTKESKPAEAQPAPKTAAERTKSASTGSSRARSTGTRSAGSRRSVRASAKRRARKQRR